MRQSTAASNPRMGHTMKLQISYDPQSDTLDIGNGLPGSDGQQIADGFTAFFDDDDVVSITLENALEILTPYLRDAFDYRELSSPASILRDAGV